MHGAVMAVVFGNILLAGGAAADECENRDLGIPPVDQIF